MERRWRGCREGDRAGEYVEHVFVQCTYVCMCVLTGVCPYRCTGERDFFVVVVVMVVVFMCVCDLSKPTGSLISSSGFPRTLAFSSYCLHLPSHVGQQVAL